MNIDVADIQAGPCVQACGMFKNGKFYSAGVGTRYQRTSGPCGRSRICLRATRLPSGAIVDNSPKRFVWQKG